MKQTYLCLLTFSLSLWGLSQSQVGSEFSVFHQPGARFTNQGYASEALGQQNLRSGVVLTEKLGYEHFMGDAGDHHGLRASVLGTYSVNNTVEVSAGAGYRTLGRNWGDFELGVSFDSKSEDFEWETGFTRSFVMDSYLSYAGKGNGPEETLGEARLQEFHANLIWNDKVLRYGLRPSLGWVTAGSTPSNLKGALKGSVALLMIQEDVFDLDLIYEAGFQHFEMDASGSAYSSIEPYPGGYFSPRLYVEQIPHISAKYRPDNSMELSFSVGPSFQILREFQKGSSFGVGAISHLGFEYQMTERASLKSNLSYLSLQNQFGRFQTTFDLSYGI